MDCRRFGIVLDNAAWCLVTLSVNDASRRESHAINATRLNERGERRGLA